MRPPRSVLAVALDDPSSRLIAYLYLLLVPLTVPITVLTLNRKRKKRGLHKRASARRGRVNVEPSEHPATLRSGSAAPNTSDPAAPEALPKRIDSSAASLFGDVSNVNTLALRHQRKVGFAASKS